MQMLQIPREVRDRLSAENLLAINSRGQEVLQGLSFDESQFLIDCRSRPRSTDSAVLDRCTELALKHERARLRIATADDESTANSERPVLALKF